MKKLMLLLAVMLVLGLSQGVVCGSGIGAGDLKPWQRQIIEAKTVVEKSVRLGKTIPELLKEDPQFYTRLKGLSIEQIQILSKKDWQEPAPIPGSREAKEKAKAQGAEDAEGEVEWAVFLRGPGPSTCEWKASTPEKNGTATYSVVFGHPSKNDFTMTIRHSDGTSEQGTGTFSCESKLLVAKFPKGTSTFKYEPVADNTIRIGDLTYRRTPEVANWHGGTDPAYAFNTKVDGRTGKPIKQDTMEDYKEFVVFEKAQQIEKAKQKEKEKADAKFPLAHPDVSKWVAFTTVRGGYVGDPEQMKVYYDKSSLRVGPEFAHVYMRCGGHTDLIMFSKWFPYGFWVYQAESDRVSYGRSSNIPPKRIIKGTVYHLLLKSIAKDHPIVGYND